MRRDWAEITELSGIEGVGVIHSYPGNEFAVGAKVAALMGGMTRTILGICAEYTRVPVSNVIAIESALSWEQLAALPESYATAWTVLFRNLELGEGKIFLIRGGTSSFGQAAINVAVNAGAKVIATTRNLDRAAFLKSLGVQEVIQEGAELSKRLKVKPIDAVLGLVGNRLVMGSLAIVRRGGRVCLTSFLNGLAAISDFNPLLQVPSGVHFSFFGSFHFGTPGFELSDMPLQQIA